MGKKNEQKHINVGRRKEDSNPAECGERELLEEQLRESGQAEREARTVAGQEKH